MHFEGFDDTYLAKTPTAFLVPVGEDRMKAVGDNDTVLSWKVVDQTISSLSDRFNTDSTWQAADLSSHLYFFRLKVTIK